MVRSQGKDCVPFCGPTKPGYCADITRARRLRLVRALADGPAVEILTAGTRRRTRPRATAEPLDGMDPRSVVR